MILEWLRISIIFFSFLVLVVSGWVFVRSAAMGAGRWEGLLV